MTYEILKNRSAYVKDANETMKLILNHVDEYGEATIEEGSLKISGESYDTDQVTYTFKSSSVRKLAKASEEDILAFLEAHQADLQKAHIKSGEQTVYQYAKDNVRKLSEWAEEMGSDTKIGMTFHLDKQSHRLLSFQLEAKNLNDHTLKIQLDAPLNEKVQIRAEVEYTYDEETDYDHDTSLSLTIAKKQTEKSTIVSAELEGKRNGQKVNFSGTLSRKQDNKLEIELSRRTGSSTAERKTVTLYDFVSRYGVDGLASEVYQIEDTLLLQTDGSSFTLSNANEYPSERKAYDDITFSVTLSKQTQIKPFIGTVNFFDFDEEQAEKLIHSEEWEDRYVNYYSIAATVDNACKTYYSGIVSGTINKSNFDSTDNLPEENAAPSRAKTLALEATVGEALRHSGQERLKDKLIFFGVTLDGNIYYEKDEDHQKDFVTAVKITSSTRMRELFYK